MSADDHAQHHVHLDRAKLVPVVVERERRVVGALDDDEDDFVREMTGHSKHGKSYGLDPKIAERIYSDYRSHRKHKKRKSFLDELFDGGMARFLAAWRSAT